MNETNNDRDGQLGLRVALARLVGQYPTEFLLLVFVTGLQSLVNGLSVLVVAPIVDLLFRAEETSSSRITEWLVDRASGLGLTVDVEVLFVAFGSTLVVGGILGVVTKFLILKIKYRVLEDLLGSTLRRFFTAGYQFFGNGEIGKLLNSFQKELEKLGDSLGLSVTGLVSILQGLVYVSIPLFLYPDISIRFLIIGLVLTLPLWLLRRFSIRFGTQSTSTNNLVMKVIHEALTGAKVILAFGRADEIEIRYRDAFSAHARAAISFSTLVSGVSLLFIPLGSVAALIAIYHAYEGGHGVTDLAVVLFGFFRGLPHLASALQAKTSIEGFLPAFKQVDDLSAQARSLAMPDGYSEFDTVGQGIVFEEVDFSYIGTSGRAALQNVSFEIEANKVTALIGESGSGKTTAIDLVLGLYQPTSGKVLIDGVPLQEISRASYLRKVGYVPQDPYLFDDSIKGNLLWANREASEPLIEKALESAYLDDLVRGLEEGVETHVGDRGGRLSGGQRQRVALARAIVMEPAILLLDEFTSALDEKSERYIVDAIQRLSGKVTIVVVTHRRELTKIADNVVVFDQGSIIKEGSYEAIAPLIDQLSSRS